MNEIINKMEKEMSKSIQVLKRDLGKLRSGKASTSIVENLEVEYYGSKVPLSQVSNITTPDARTIKIAPWEANMLGVIDKVILAANLGFTPQNDGKIIRISLPLLTEESRKEMVKVVKKMGEETKIALRNHRRSSNDEVKKEEKNGSLSEDDSKRVINSIQKSTDKHIGMVDEHINIKEKEILTI